MAGGPWIFFVFPHTEFSHFSTRGSPQGTVATSEPFVVEALPRRPRPLASADFAWEGSGEGTNRMGSRPKDR